MLEPSIDEERIKLMYSAESFYNRCSYLQAIDGNNVRTLNIQWLRSHIGIVSQEPILFGCSYKSTITLGISISGETGKAVHLVDAQYLLYRGGQSQTLEPKIQSWYSDYYLKYL